MRTPALMFLPCLAAGLGLPAQDVSITASMVQPWTAAAQLGAQTDSGTGTNVPVSEGRFVDLGPAGHSQVILDSGSYQYSFAAAFFVQHDMQVASSGLPASATASTEVLVQIATTFPTTVELHLRSSLVGNGGALMPVVEFDVDNDGSIETSGWFTWATSVVSLSPAQPKLVRVRVQTSLVTPGLLNQYVSVNVVPHNQTTVSWASAGCFDQIGFGPSPTFSGGLELAPWSVNPDPMVVVVGIGLQPTILPANVTLPCLLLPSPDILILASIPSLPPGAYVLPLPPSVRPVTFWAQAVSVSPLGLPVTDAFRVDAL